MFPSCRALVVAVACSMSLPVMAEERNRTMEEALKMHREATKALLDALDYDQYIMENFKEDHPCRQRLEANRFEFRGQVRGHTQEGEHMLWMLLDSPKPVAANQVNMGYWMSYWTVDGLKKWKEAVGKC